MGRGRPKQIDTMRPAERLDKLSDEQKAFIETIKVAKNDPVFFAERVLKLELHPGQKVWLWMSCQQFISDGSAPESDGVDYKAAMLDKAFEEGKTIDMWDTREEFEERIRGVDFMKNILVPSNRWGKTFVTSVKHIYVCYFKKGVRGTAGDIARTRCGTLNLSPHSKQCTAGHAYVESIVNGEFSWIALDGTPKNNEECLIKDFFVSSVKASRTIYFANGTSYQAVPTGDDQGSSLAGTKYLYISYDECAQSLHLKAELPAKIMSRLIDFGGPCDLVSTPEVDRASHQYFFRIAKLGLEGREGWFTLVGKITDNAFLGAAERDKVLENIKSTDPTKYRQVAFGEFVTTGSKMFDTLVIERLWDRQGPEMPMMDHNYILSADWGFADTGDPTVFYVVDYTQDDKWKQGDEMKYRIVYRESVQGGSPFALFAHAKMLQRTWNGAKFIHDAAALGGTIISKSLREMEVKGLVDFNASGGNKADMLFAFLVVLTSGREAVYDGEGRVIEKNPDFGRLRSYLIPELEEQMGNYQFNPEKGITDKKLEQDDIMALGQAIWYLERKVNRSKAKTMKGFNPLAPTVDKIFSGDDKQSVRIRSVEIKERVIN